MSCAWPDPEVGHRHTAEFCENGAKAVAEEATRDRATPEFFAAHSIAELDAHTEHWLGQQGRITHPMVKRPGRHPLRADRLGRGLRADRRRAARAGQPGRGDLLHLRPGLQRGGLRLPAVRPRLRHQQPARLLEHVPRVDEHRPAGVHRHRQGQRHARGRPHRVELIVIAGQNPGTNHPRMLSALEIAKQNGAKIISINPLREAGLVRFKNPQKPKGVVGHGHRPWPTCTCPSRSTATWPCSRRSARCWSSGTRSTTSSSTPTHGVRAVARPRPRRRLGPGRRGRPG